MPDHSGPNGRPVCIARNDYKPRGQVALHAVEPACTSSYSAADSVLRRGRTGWVGQGCLRLPDRAVSGGPFMSGLAILRVIVDLVHVTPGRNAQRIARAGVVARNSGCGLTR